MVYKIRIVSDEVENFRRDILIDAESTFEDLKNAICDSTGYNPSLISSFYICNDEWEKLKEITFEDMGNDMMKDLYLMSDTRLDDLIDDVGQKLLFTFDFLADRSLFLQVKDEEFGTVLDKPECVFSRGDAPAQETTIEEVETLIKNTPAPSETNYDLDEDFLGSTDYNDEDIEGYDEMNY